jgi:NAD(P)-dependent dehydrogenase (short-subunit alcohol dehydrogenase family)
MPFSTAPDTALATPPQHPLKRRPRTVLVTGGAKRLGREIALALARAGWRVAVHYRQAHEDAIQTAADCDTSIAESGYLGIEFPALAVSADFAIEAQVRQLVPTVVAAFGYLDAVVNSAALFEHDGVDSFSYANLTAHLVGNTAAPIVLAQALAQHWRATNGTRTEHPQHKAAQPPQRPRHAVVVNLLDQKLWNPNPDFLSYTLSKAALEAANTLLAQALAPQVRVVGVAPGLTLTSHMLETAQFERLHKLSPLGHSSSAADVAATVRFALENESLTGTTLLVDGGQHLMRFERDFSLM